VGFHPLKPSGKRPVRGKNSEENLEKNSPYVLLVFLGDQGLHGIRPEVVMQFVDVEKGLVGFPTIT